MTTRSPLDPLYGLPTNQQLQAMRKSTLIELLVQFATEMVSAKKRLKELDIKAPWVVIDAEKQELRCDRCGGTHPLADGINERPVWFACGVMHGFTNHHKDCQR